MKSRPRDTNLKRKITVVFLIFNVACIFILGVNTFAKKPDFAESSLVYLGGDGRLVYNNYTNYGESLAINRIPDFSHAGYEGGGVSIPTIDVNLTLEADDGDNQPQIQHAINQVASYTPDSNGFRGAILLKKGYYEVFSPLYINASGIVLRGEGQGMDGTIIKDMNLEEGHTFLNLRGSGSGFDENLSTNASITSPYVPTGSSQFSVNSTADFAPGDEIVIFRRPNEKWFEDIDISIDEDWNIDDFTLGHERKIVSIIGNRIEIDIPIVDPIQDKYGGGYVMKSNVTGRISHCGVENLRLVSYFASDIDELHGWRAIELKRTENSWVRKVTAQYFGRSCVTIDKLSNFNTVEDCAMIDPMSLTRGSRKYSFEIDEGMGNLFQRCYSRAGRHDYVTGSKVVGPNAWVDCISVQNHEDNGPHGKWATGSLYDSIKGGDIACDNHGTVKVSQGWAGVQNMFWNYDLDGKILRLANPLGTRNWAIGCRGEFYIGDGFVEHWQVPVLPRSLYLQQLEDRLGEDAVNNIAIQAQRDGYIWDLLADWAGEGDLDDYVS